VRVLELGSRGQDLGVGEPVDDRDGPGVIEVQVRLKDEAHVDRVDAEGLQLRHARLLGSHHGDELLRDLPPMRSGIGRALGGVAAIDEHVAPRVGDEKPRDRNLDGLLQAADSS